MSESPQVQAAISVLRAHLIALNAHDETALAETLHFPHYRLSEGRLMVWECPDVYFRDFRERAGKSWGYTEWGELRPLQESADKVHMAVRVERFEPDGTPLGAFASLWVIAKLNGKWAAQLRSSFAKDSELGLKP